MGIISRFLGIGSEYLGMGSEGCDRTFEHSTVISERVGMIAVLSFVRGASPKEKF